MSCDKRSRVAGVEGDISRICNAPLFCGAFTCHLYLPFFVSKHGFKSSEIREVHDMYRRIMVASDLSDRSLHAVMRAVRLAISLNSDVSVIHIVDDAIPTTVAREVRSSAEEYLRSVVAQSHEGRGDQLRVEVRSGAVWKTILEAADRNGADLIVMGSHRFRGLAELFRGTTLERVVRLSKVPVLMVPNEPVSNYQNILVGVDFSPASTAATTSAASLSPKGRITLVSSYHIPFRTLVDRDEPGDEDMQAEKRRIEYDLKKRMSDYVATLPGDTRKFRTSFVEGGAAQSLITLAAYEEADLICVGSHGRSWLSRTLLGSTAEELLYRATCDVLVAKM